MKLIEAHICRVFVVSSAVLFAMGAGVVAIQSGILSVDESIIPRVAVQLFKAIFVVSILAVVYTALAIPGLMLIQKRKIRRPSEIAATILLTGLLLILLHGVYVKLRTCPYVGSPDWYCQMDKESYVGMVVVASIFSSLVGSAVWIGYKYDKEHSFPS